MSSSNIRLRVDKGRKGCKVQDGFQKRAMQVKESNDRSCSGQLLTRGFGYLYTNSKYGSVNCW